MVFALLMILLSTAVWAAPAQSGRPQKLASAGTVPEGLSAPEWSGIRQQCEQQRHGDATVQEWFVNDQRGLEHGFTVRERPLLRSAGFPTCCIADFLIGRPFDVARSAGWETCETADLKVCATADERAGALQDAAAPSLNSSASASRSGATAPKRSEGGQPGTLNFILTVRGGLRPEIQADGRGVRFVDAQGTAALTYSELTVLDADGRKLPARFEAVEENPLGSRGRESAHSSEEGNLRRLTSAATERLRLAIDERGARYPLTIDPIAQQAYLKASATDPMDCFACSVAVSGDTVVVGAWGESSSATGVDGDQSDNSAEFAGAAYVFVRNGTTWTQQAYLKASNTDTGDRFGQSVAISGDTVVVGAYLEDSNATGVDGDQYDNSADNSGAAYVFVRSGTTWTQEAYLKASNPGGRSGSWADGDQFGGSVAVSGDTVVVGAHGEDSSATGVDGDGSDNSATNSGAAYVFVRSGTTWTQQAYLKASNIETWDQFGSSVAVSGDTVVVGALYEDSSATGVNGNQTDNSAANSGAAYVFVRNGTTWTQQAYLKASNTGAGDFFGGSVAVSGNTVVVGAVNESSSATGVNGNQSDTNAPYSGAAYVFVRNGTTWTQQAYLKASNTGAGDAFGGSVAVSGDTVVVGARGESSNARGVNGNQSNNSATNSGAAYVFVRNATNWSQQAYLKASNTGGANPRTGAPGDWFGGSVAVSGDTVVVGAHVEQSVATGVNGDQNDNSGTNRGAAYTFAGVGIGRTLAVAPDGSGGYLLGFNGAPEITYRLQRAPSVTGPWSDLVTNTAPASGRIEYHEISPPPGAAFYRTAQP